MSFRSLVPLRNASGTSVDDAVDHIQLFWDETSGFAFLHAPRFTGSVVEMWSVGRDRGPLERILVLPPGQSTGVASLEYLRSKTVMEPHEFVSDAADKADGDRFKLTACRYLLRCPQDNHERQVVVFLRAGRILPETGDHLWSEQEHGDFERMLLQHFRRFAGKDRSDSGVSRDVLLFSVHRGEPAGVHFEPGVSPTVLMELMEEHGNGCEAMISFCVGSVVLPCLRHVWGRPQGASVDYEVSCVSDDFTRMRIGLRSPHAGALPGDVQVLLIPGKGPVRRCASDEEGIEWALNGLEIRDVVAIEAPGARFLWLNEWYGERLFLRRMLAMESGFLACEEEAVSSQVFFEYRYGEELAAVLNGDSVLSRSLLEDIGLRPGYWRRLAALRNEVDGFLPDSTLSRAVDWPALLLHFLPACVKSLNDLLHNRPVSGGQGDEAIFGHHEFLDWIHVAHALTSSKVPGVFRSGVLQSCPSFWNRIWSAEGSPLEALGRWLFWLMAHGGGEVFAAVCGGAEGSDHLFGLYWMLMEKGIYGSDGNTEHLLARLDSESLAGMKRSELAALDPDEPEANKAEEAGDILSVALSGQGERALESLAAPASFLAHYPESLASRLREFATEFPEHSWQWAALADLDLVPMVEAGPSGWNLAAELDQLDRTIREHEAELETNHGEFCSVLGCGEPGRKRMPERLSEVARFHLRRLQMETLMALAWLEQLVKTVGLPWPIEERGAHIEEYADRNPSMESWGPGGVAEGIRALFLRVGFEEEEWFKKLLDPEVERHLLAAAQAFKRIAGENAKAHGVNDEDLATCQAGLEQGADVLLQDAALVSTALQFDSILEGVAERVDSWFADVEGLLPEQRFPLEDDILGFREMLKMKGEKPAEVLQEFSRIGATLAHAKAAALDLGAIVDSLGEPVLRAIGIEVSPDDGKLHRAAQVLKKNAPDCFKALLDQGEALAVCAKGLLGAGALFEADERAGLEKFTEDLEVARARVSGNPGQFSAGHWIECLGMVNELLEIGESLRGSAIAMLKGRCRERILSIEEPIRKVFNKQVSAFLKGCDGQALTAFIGDVDRMGELVKRIVNWHESCGRALIERRLSGLGDDLVVQAGVIAGQAAGIEALVRGGVSKELERVLLECEAARNDGRYDSLWRRLNGTLRDRTERLKRDNRAREVLDMLELRHVPEDVEGLWEWLAKVRRGAGRLANGGDDVAAELLLKYGLGTEDESDG